MGGCPNCGCRGCICDKQQSAFERLSPETQVMVQQAENLGRLGYTERQLREVEDERDSIKLKYGNARRDSECYARKADDAEAEVRRLTAKLKKLTPKKKAAKKAAK